MFPAILVSLGCGLGSGLLFVVWSGEKYVETKEGRRIAYLVFLGAVFLSRLVSIRLAGRELEPTGLALIAEVLKIILVPALTGMCAAERHGNLTRYAVTLTVLVFLLLLMQGPGDLQFSLQ